MSMLRVWTDSTDIAIDSIIHLLRALWTEGIETFVEQDLPSSIGPADTILLIHVQYGSKARVAEFARKAGFYNPSRVAIVALGERWQDSLADDPNFERYAVADLTEWRGDRLFAQFRSLVGLCRRLLGEAGGTPFSPRLLGELRRREGAVQSTLTSRERSVLRPLAVARARMMQRQSEERRRAEAVARQIEEQRRRMEEEPRQRSEVERYRMAVEERRWAEEASRQTADRVAMPHRPARRYAGVLIAGIAIAAAIYWRQELSDWLNPIVRRLLGAVTLFKGAVPPAPAIGDEIDPDNLVEASVFAPSGGRPGEDVLVQVFLHRLADAALIEGIAREPDEFTKRRGSATLAAEIAIGTRVDITIEAPGLIAKDGFADNTAAQYLIWRGRPQSCQFLLRLLTTGTERAHTVTVRLFISGTPIGLLRFMLKVAADQPAEPPRVPPGTGRRFEYAFMSYASGDRPEVLKYAYALKAARIGFFQDLLHIQAGTEWEMRLNQEIDKCDLFLLFWSAKAAASDWVLRETLRALQRQAVSDDNLPEITPIILEGPPVPLPPDPLKHLHFNDALRYVIAAAETAQSPRPDLH